MGSKGFCGGWCCGFGLIGLIQFILLTCLTLHLFLAWSDPVFATYGAGKVATWHFVLVPAGFCLYSYSYLHKPLGLSPTVQYAFQLAAAACFTFAMACWYRASHDQLASASSDLTGAVHAWSGWFALVCLIPALIAGTMQYARHLLLCGCFFDGDNAGGYSDGYGGYTSWGKGYDYGYDYGLEEEAADANSLLGGCWRGLVKCFCGRSRYGNPVARLNRKFSELSYVGMFVCALTAPHLLPGVFSNKEYVRDFPCDMRDAGVSKAELKAFDAGLVGDNTLVAKLPATAPVVTELAAKAPSTATADEAFPFEEKTEKKTESRKLEASSDSNGAVQNLGDDLSSAVSDLNNALGNPLANVNSSTNEAIADTQKTIKKASKGVYSGWTVALAATCGVVRRSYIWAENFGNSASAGLSSGSAGASSGLSESVAQQQQEFNKSFDKVFDNNFSSVTKQTLKATKQVQAVAGKVQGAVGLVEKPSAAVAAMLAGGEMQPAEESESHSSKRSLRALSDDDSKDESGSGVEVGSLYMNLGVYVNVWTTVLFLISWGVAKLSHASDDLKAATGSYWSGATDSLLY